MITPELYYQPKGSMCSVCLRQQDYCGHLNFSAMPPISKGDQDGIVIVKCTEFEPAGHSNAKRN